MELYHNVLLRTSSVDFLPIRTKLMELAAKGKADKLGSIGCIDLVPGEGSKGQIKQTAPDVIQQMQARLRLLHHPLSTERAYLG